MKQSITTWTIWKFFLLYILEKREDISESVTFKSSLNILTKGVKVENLKFLNVKNYMNVTSASCYKKNSLNNGFQTSQEQKGFVAFQTPLWQGTVLDGIEIAFQEVSVISFCWCSTFNKW